MVIIFFFFCSINLKLRENTNHEKLQHFCYKKMNNTIDFTIDLKIEYILMRVFLGEYVTFLFFTNLVLSTLCRQFCII
jgi:hypothetical protein